MKKPYLVTLMAAISLLATFAIVAPAPAQADTTTINVCSQNGTYFYNINGANATSLRTKLDNPANFGPAGAYGDFDFNYVNVADNFTEATIVANGCNIWYSGYELDSTYTATELAELLNWVSNSNGQVIAGCDGSNNDPVCDLLDFTVTTDVDTFGFVVEKALNPLTCDGLLDDGDELNMAGGVGGYFSGSGVTADNTIAIHESSAGKPIVVYTGNFFMTADINMMQTGGTELTVTDGPDVVTNNDILTMNAFSSLADASIGNSVCASVVTDITLSPGTATSYVGETHTVTATVTTDDPVAGTPIVGTDVTFTVVAGPHAGTTGVAETDASGSASFSYAGTSVGDDSIQASFVRDDGEVVGSNIVTKTWEERPLEIDLSPDTAINDLGTQPTHTVTATVLEAGEPLEGALVEFIVSGASGLHGPTSVATDATGQASYTYPGSALGYDDISACVESDVCDVVEKQWVDVTAPVAACAEGPNASGKVPASPGRGFSNAQNPDGFFTVWANDLVDTAPELYVMDSGSNTVFGPFASGTNIKYVEANGAEPSISAGSGEVDWKIKGQGDAMVYALDSNGNTSVSTACLVPPDPQ